MLENILKLSLLWTWMIATTAGCAGVSGAHILPETSIMVRHCSGGACPTISIPLQVPGAFDVPANITADCESDKFRVIPNPTDCTSYYACRNGTVVKYQCTLGYAYHPRWKLCLPETLVKSCGKVYCPPTILVGVVPDPRNCTRFYRCIYNIPVHYQCEEGSVYDEETGKCREFGDEVPECVGLPKGNYTLPSTTEHTEVPVTEDADLGISTSTAPTETTVLSAQL